MTNDSDIDDTLLSALFDTRYPELTVYPGIHQFVHEVQRLSLVPEDLEKQSDDTDGSDDEENQRKRTSKRTKNQRITFLTARPEILRRRTTKELRACGFVNFTCTCCLGQWVLWWSILIEDCATQCSWADSRTSWARGGSRRGS